MVTIYPVPIGSAMVGAKPIRGAKPRGGKIWCLILNFNEV